MWLAGSRDAWDVVDAGACASSRAGAGTGGGAAGVSGGGGGTPMRRANRRECATMGGAEPASQLEEYHTHGYYFKDKTPGQVSVEQLVQLKQRDADGGDLGD